MLKGNRLDEKCFVLVFEAYAKHKLCFDICSIKCVITVYHQIIILCFFALILLIATYINIYPRYFYINLMIFITNFRGRLKIKNKYFLAQKRTFSVVLFKNNNKEIYSLFPWSRIFPVRVFYERNSCQMHRFAFPQKNYLLFGGKPKKAYGKVNIE